MRVEMVMPQMGESITEGIISKWLVKSGDRVEKDQTILEISTDKVDSEIPAPVSGVIAEILHGEGDVVPVKQVIARIETDGAAAEESFRSPLVKALAEKHDLTDSELASIPGSGQKGRVTGRDVEKYVEQKDSSSILSESGAKPAPESEAEPAEEVKSPLSDPGIDWGTDDQKVVTMDNVRQAIADHMVRSKHTSPHVYSVQEVDVTAVLKFRDAHKARFEAEEKFKLSITPFFLEAAVLGLLKFPYLNASVEGKNIILKNHVNLGCAVAIGAGGLIVPVIKRAEEKNLNGLARSLKDLATRARSKKLLPDDVAGGTFTVTNPGMFGTLIGTPIINQPQVAILCIGAIKKRPVVIDDMIAIREMCYLTLSYDHRVVDGVLAAQYLGFVAGHLENWASPDRVRQGESAENFKQHLPPPSV